MSVTRPRVLLAANFSQFLSVSKRSVSNDLTVEFLKQRFVNLNKPNYYETLLAKNDYISKMKRASILIPISIKTETDPNGASVKKSYFTLTKRTDIMKTHTGEVCFLGGKRDSSDLSEVHTAYREAKEECNLNESDTVFLAQLCPIITFTQLLVTPVIVYFDQANFKPRLNKTEVDLFFDLPTERFLTKTNHEMKCFKNESGEYYIHYFNDIVQKREVCTWGLTAFLSIVVSAILNGRAAEFDLIPHSKGIVGSDVNKYLEDYLFSKLAVSREYFKKHEKS
jgi:8-oxo-dGTP pyrophosphatase MutT (NUDIX family)